jgi:hypothetical protein
MMYGAYIVRLEVAGRGLDFWLDSSASDSIINWDVAREMGLPDYGHVTHLADGTKVPYRTKLAQASVGGVTLNDFTLTSEDFTYQPSYSTKVVGVLGYDFFAANVLHLDFTKGIVEALPLAQFASGNPTGQASTFRLHWMTASRSFAPGSATSSPIALCSARPCRLASSWAASPTPIRRR